MSPRADQRLRLVGRTEVASESHTGLVRQQNQDAYLVDSAHGLHLVADGMGSPPAGDVAAQLTRDEIGKLIGRWPRRRFAEERLEDLVAAVRGANTRVWTEGQEKPARRGLGSTVAAVFWPTGSTHAAIAHVGDSRVYLLRKGRLEQKTRDHSVLNAALDQFPRLSAEAQAELKRTSGHVISRAIGTAPNVEVDGQLVAMAPGDTLLLSTDGLHGCVAEPDIATHLALPPGRAVKALIKATLDAGAPDNVTVIVVRHRRGA